MSDEMGFNDLQANIKRIRYEDDFFQDEKPQIASMH